MDQISVSDLKNLLEKQPSICLIDVRETMEFEAYHVPGAGLMPLSSFDGAKAAEDLSVAGTNQPIYVLCQVGGRAAQACAMLEAAGHPHTVLVSGGTSAWAEAGFPLAAGQ